MRNDRPKATERLRDREVQESLSSSSDRSLSLDGQAINQATGCNRRILAGNVRGIWAVMYVMSSRRSTRRVAAVMFTVAFLPGPSAVRSSSASATPVPDARQPALVTVEVGSFPNAVVFGAGSAWVAAQRWHTTEGVIVRLDPTNGGVQARTPIESPPTWEIGGAGMAFGEGSLWVTGGGSDGAMLTRIDATTNEISDVISLGGSFGADVTIDPAGIWVLIFRDHGLSVIRIDPTTHQVLARIPIPGFWSNQIFSSSGLIWVTASLPNDQNVVPGNRRLFGIDPATNSMVDRFRLPFRGFPQVVPSGDEVIWANDWKSIRRFDPSTGKTFGPRVRTHLVRQGSLTADGTGGLWSGRFGHHGQATFIHVTADGTIDTHTHLDDPNFIGIAYRTDPATQILCVVHNRRSVTFVTMQ